MVRIALERLLKQVRQPRKAGVQLKAPPLPAASALVRLRAQQLQRSRHVPDFHPCQCSPVERQPVAIDVGTTQPRPGRQHHHAALAVATHPLRLGHATHVPIIAKRKRKPPSGRLAKRLPEIRLHVPATRNSSAGSARHRARRNCAADPAPPHRHPSPAPSDRSFCSRNSPIAPIHARITPSVPPSDPVGRCSRSIVTAVPSPRTAAIFEVVAPPSMPMKIDPRRLMVPRGPARTRPAT
jgi:hypothetical protein